MAKISGYSTIDIDDIARKIATVKHGKIFYIWFEDVRDVNNFKTTGYVIQRNAENNATIMPVNRGGILPDNVADVINQIINTKPDWTRDTPDAVPIV